MINKKIQKIIAMGMITTTMLIPISANAEWKKDNIGWWYTEGNSYAKDGWKLINNNWYYFDSNGYMNTGWIQDTNGKWYYLSPQGNMLSNIVTPDGYTLNIDGSWNVSVPKTENKQMATAPVVENTANNTNNSNVEENTENNSTEDNSSTTTKKRKSSSSSSSSSSSNKIVNARDYFVVYYLDDTDEVVRVKVSNEPDPYYRDEKLCPYVIIKWSDLNIGTLEETSHSIIYDYEVKDGQLIKKDNIYSEKNDYNNNISEDSQVTTDSQVAIK